MSLSELAHEKLNAFQKDVYKECQTKGSGCMWLPMGSGKTLLGLALGLESGTTLVVCSVSLIPNWIAEIKKWFGDSLPYTVLHTSMNKKLASFSIEATCKVVIVSVDLLAQHYKRLDPDFKKVVEIKIFEFRRQFYYQTRKTPAFPGLDKGISAIFGRQWDTLLIDEAQDYCNPAANNCRAISAIAATHRWALSGTPILNPKPERMLGYYALIGYDCPRCMEEFEPFIQSDNFPGLSESMVIRKKNGALASEVKIEQVIISHSLNKNEEKVYQMFKKTVVEINKQIQELKRRYHTPEEIKRLSGRLLAIITYLRQGLLSPLLPITNIALAMADYSLRNELSQIINAELGKLNLKDWLDDEASVKSSRMHAVIELLEKHPEKVVIFVSHRTSVDLLRYFLKRPVFFLAPGMSVPRRQKVLEQFEGSDGGVLLLTYQIGGKGLNLQCASTCFIVDFEWSSDITLQAITRLARMGQLSPSVKVYLFTSNTGIEKVIFDKQFSKQEVIKQLMKGKVTEKVASASFFQFVSTLVSREDNIKVLEKVYLEEQVIEPKKVKGGRKKE